MTGMFNQHGSLRLVVLSLVASACAKPLPVARPSEVAMHRTYETAFSRPGPAADRRVEPTSLLGVPDAQAVNEIVRVRVRAAMRRAFTDAMAAISRHADSRSVAELTSVLAAVLFDGTDAEARSQALLGVLLRNGLAYGLAMLDIPADTTCTDLHARATVSYEAMASSPRLRKLGFAKSTGTVPAGCEVRAKVLSEILNAATTLGTSIAPVVELIAAVDRVRITCTPAVLGGTSVELRTALGALSSSARLADVARIRDAFDQGKALFDKESLLRDQADLCHAGLTGLVRAAEAVPTLWTLGGEVRLDELVAAFGRSVGQLLGISTTAYATALDGVVRIGRALPAFDAAVQACRGALQPLVGTGVVERIQAASAACSQACPASCSVVEPIAGALAELHGELIRRTPALAPLVAAAKACAQAPPLATLTSCAAGTPCATACPAFATAVANAGKELAAAQQAARDLVKYAQAMALVLDRLEEQAGVLRALVEGRAPDRGDLVTAARGLRALIARLPKGVGRDLLADLVEALPQLVKEEATGRSIHVDSSAATSIVLNRLTSSRSRWHLRAGIGTGYIHVDEAAPSLYEELGVGLRVAGGSRLRLDLTAFTSGLLFQIGSETETDNRMFLGGGASVRVYDLIDVSAAIGAMLDLSNGDAKFAVLVGLQVPLVDYFSALAGSSATVAKP